MFSSVSCNKNFISICFHHDDSQAVEWYDKAAKQGDVGAQAIGFLYSGGHGVAKDYREAAKWLLIGAERGDLISQNYLGELYKNGQGVPKDIVQAYMWLNLSLAQILPGGNPS